jgi:hypothetical protein
VTDFTKEIGFDWEGQSCGAFSANAVLQNLLVSSTINKNKSTRCVNNETGGFDVRGHSLPSIVKSAGREREERDTSTLRPGGSRSPSALR